MKGDFTIMSMPDYETIRGYYLNGSWNDMMLRTAKVCKAITEEQFEAIRDEKANAAAKPKTTTKKTTTAKKSSSTTKKSTTTTSAKKSTSTTAKKTTAKKKTSASA